jgi:drug/metabolite transporter (DMT)-like permease
VRIILSAVIALILLGMVPVVIKLTAANIFTIGVVRLAGGTVFTAAYIVINKKRVVVTPFEAMLLVLLGLFFGVHWLTYFYSLKIGSASIATLGLSTYSIFLMLFGHILKQHKFTLLDMTAVVLVVAGILYVIPQLSLENEISQGLAFSCFSGCVYAVLPLLHHKLSNVALEARTLAQFLFALLLFGCFFDYTNWDLVFRDWCYLFFLAVLGTYVAHSLWGYVTSMMSTRITGLIYYAYIPVTMALSFLLLDEKITVPMLMGAICIVMGNIAMVAGRVFPR